jgi:hypothetical protein
MLGGASLLLISAVFSPPETGDSSLWFRITTIVGYAMLMAGFALAMKRRRELTQLRIEKEKQAAREMDGDNPAESG